MWFSGHKQALFGSSTLFSIALLVQLVECGPPKTCPTYCNCNLLENLNHADCSGKRLISPNSGVPFEVQSLNLNYNDITILDNNCFEGYVYLLNITIAHNAIHTIFLDVFTPLKRIRVVDLSYNRLETIDPRLFESNRRLHIVNLAGNKFLSLPNEPLLHSKSLRKLNLADAQINVLLPEHYSGLPQLQELDLTQNLIITIDQFAALPPKQLRVLNLDENNLNCDQTLQTAMQQLKGRNVEVDYSYCQAADPVDEAKTKFERIELMDEHKDKRRTEMEIAADDVGDSQEDFDDNIRSGVLTDWHFPVTSIDDTDDYTDFDVVENEESDTVPSNTYNDTTTNETCRRWCHYYGNNTFPKRTWNDGIDFRAKLYSEIDLLFVFICGSAVGIALTIFIGSCIICIWRCSSLRSRQVQVEDPYGTPYAVVSPSRQQTIPPQPPASHAAVDTIRIPSARESEPTQDLVPVIYPQPPRRRQRRAPSAQRAVVRRDNLAHPGSDNFISRLFGRPARHQYYRTINENTATLIRRLSRSNLFNNRLSQHFGERDRGRDRERNSSSSTPNTPPDSPDGAHAPNLDNELNSLTTATRVPHRRRPETPPPLYSEIVNKDSDRITY
ncbi:PREDICTED: uncharacterized protein LOC108969352 [Bactrocera latifrons]|uniref:Slit 2 protein n=1 Tax=Bactrocera latifrons TaxID=174628 RepID=A0A0K8VJ95_BACLA|nr:PREDICTED: uncharacterized protein LOC108969352 [Bactrocera latifrons]